MNTYNTGKIYRIYSDLIDLIGLNYIGSTFSTSLDKRLISHRGASSEGRKSKFYTVMRNRGKYNFFIELIEDYPCYNREELSFREDYWINKYCSKLYGWNTRDACMGMTLKEYRINNKSLFRLAQRKYYNSNKDMLISKQKKSYASKSITAILNKSYYCDFCNYNAPTDEGLKKHLLTDKHKINSYKPTDITSEALNYHR
jgi:hypothetical protein